MLKSSMKKTASLCQNADDLQPTKNFPKQKDLSRTEQRYVGRMAKTLIRLTLVLTFLLPVESPFTTHLVCHSCRSTAVLTGIGIGGGGPRGRQHPLA